VSAMHTYVLEYETRHRQLELSSAHETSGEAIFLHLFSGAVLFETLLRTCRLGSGIGGGRVETHFSAPALPPPLWRPPTLHRYGASRARRRSREHARRRGQYAVQ